MSAYWDQDRAMLVFANLTKEEQTVDYWFTPEDKKRLTGKVTVPPMTIQTLKINI